MFFFLILNNKDLKLIEFTTILGEIISLYCTTEDSYVNQKL